ncbi:hypothetical protein Pelo_6120 [Pelomyxa schiedti]|nr:hypothetical protein Pelo_6120 [Pelomyxa schiedti]
MSCNDAVPRQRPGGSRGDTIANLMTVSRVVWEHVVDPMVSASHNRGVALTQAQCVWLVGVAEALFPLVPRVCRAVAAAARVTAASAAAPPAGSRYFVLKCGGMAGATRCVDWVLKRKATRNNTKECLAVLRGLCQGGHISMARELVEGGRRGALRWPAGDCDLLDEIREVKFSESIGHSLLYDACKGGSLEVVKWVMSTFCGVGTELWELPMPFHAAVRWGHIDVVKWLVSSTPVVEACRELLSHHRCGPVQFILSPSLDVMKFCTELFLGYLSTETPGYQILNWFMSLSEEKDESDMEEGYQWINERFSPEEHPILSGIKNPKVFKWAINRFCLALAAVCRNKHDSVSLIQVLLPNIRLDTNTLRQCLVNSLSRSNIAVADWFEQNFHVMDDVNSVPCVTERILKQICAGNLSCGTSGLQWFLSKCAISNITSIAASKAVEDNLEGGQLSLASLLLKKLDQVSFDQILQIKAVVAVTAFGDISQAKELASIVGFSPDTVAQGLSQPYVKSGKVVRWFIEYFHLNENQVKRSHNKLLFLLITSNKEGCAEWLIHTFNVTLDEIGTMGDNHTALWKKSAAHRPNVGVWKMLLRVFPEMTASFAADHLMDFVVASHLHLNVSMERLGITHADIQSRLGDPWKGAWVPFD